MAGLLDPLLVPQRLAARALDDLRRIADAAVVVAGVARELRAQAPGVEDWAQDVGDAVVTLRDEVGGVRRSLEPMSHDLDALRAEFANIRCELDKLRGAVVPELHAVRASVEEMGKLLAGDLEGLNATLRPLARDVDEVREVVEPLQSATERLGHLAERIPGPGRKRLSSSREPDPSE